MVEALTHRVLSGLKVICAPHEPTPTHIQRLVNILGEKAILYSAASQSPTIDFEKVQWLIIDNIGLLNTLYQYGDLAYIGGGFGAGIHNTLEPAAYKLPIIFGPKYQKFEEARQLVARAGAYSVHTAPELANAIKHLLTPPFRQKSENAVQEYLMEYQGATAIIMSYIRTIVLTA